MAIQDLLDFLTNPDETTVRELYVPTSEEAQYAQEQYEAACARLFDPQNAHEEADDADHRMALARAALRDFGRVNAEEAELVLAVLEEEVDLNV